MKIAIYHNLQPGGALNYMKNIIKYLSLKNSIDIYSFQKTTINNQKNIKQYIYHLNKTNNIIQHLLQIAIELKNKNKMIAKKINSYDKYDLVLIYPCLITQSPYLLRYLNYNKTNVIYMFMETKREFYEKTTYDHYSIKRIIARIIRHPIKLIDLANCKRSKNIVSLSYFSSNQIKNIYKKDAYVIHPGIQNIKPIAKSKINNQQYVSVGTLSKIKGHDFSMNQIKKNSGKLLIIGKNNPNENLRIKSNNAKIQQIKNNKIVKKLIKEASFYLANQINEPFGLSTLEASSLGAYTLGKNEGGTPEIIRHGLNGFLYPNNITIGIKIANKYQKTNQLRYLKTCKINWEKTTDNLLTLYHHLKNEPTE